MPHENLFSPHPPVVLSASFCLGKFGNKRRCVKPSTELNPAPRSAFSLILSLTMMAMLLILCIGAASLLAVQLRVAAGSADSARSRINAMAAARIALGELQTFTGQDRRITAPASIMDADPASSELSEGVLQPHLTGVWKGRSVSSAYASSHDTAFVGWLASGAPSSAAAGPSVEKHRRAGGRDNDRASRIPDDAVTRQKSRRRRVGDPSGKLFRYRGSAHVIWEIVSLVGNWKEGRTHPLRSAFVLRVPTTDPMIFQK